MVEIRRLRHSSASVVSMLNHLLVQLDDQVQELTEARLENILQSGTYVYVAVDGDTIVGTATLVPVDQLTGIKCWVEDVVVDSQCRGGGIGRKLMQHLIADVPAGTKSINLTSSQTREGARHLYRTLGFEERDESDLFRLKV